LHHQVETSRQDISGYRLTHPPQSDESNSRRHVVSPVSSPSLRRNTGIVSATRYPVNPQDRMEGESLRSQGVIQPQVKAIISPLDFCGAQIGSLLRPNPTG
jgi:hypothetical protein